MKDYESVKHIARYVPVDELELLENNPRTISEEQFEKLKKSVSERRAYFEGRPCLVNHKDGKLVVFAGNQRLKAAKALKMDKVPCVIYENLSKKEEKELTVLDNSEFGRWDTEILANEFSELPLEELMGEEYEKIMPGGEMTDYQPGALTERFGAPPFSILDARQGWWQERKTEWLDLGIKSEVGRDDDLLGAGLSSLAKKAHANTRLNGTSVFDPVLCELMYRWFNIPGGSILDPFAGGSVRGVVAHKLGYSYTGCELRAEQVEASIANASEILGNGAMPQWIVGDSNITLDTIETKFDMVLSCPPYMDLEQYSDDPADLSSMSDDEFLRFYESIIKKAVAKLKENRFAVFVISNVRDRQGFYRNLVANTIDCFEKAGCRFYNDLVLVEACSTAGLRATKTFRAGRKVIKTHQNVLVFYKGDQKLIKGIFNSSEGIKDEEKGL